ILPALSLEGILYVTRRELSFTMATFSNFIHNLLDNMNPYPGPAAFTVFK
ncbi:hypothetical protein BU17DRAFT_57250, partial [Hysterangium stoloniferum]